VAHRAEHSGVKLLVTGSTGHLGEALMRALRPTHDVVGLDIAPSAFTDVVGSITDRACVARCMRGVDAVLHTATLHKPHIATHATQDFVDTNVTGTLALLEAAVAEGVGAFVFTSTTSVFGDALVPPPGAPAAWVTEDTAPVPKNIYGVTKRAAEDLCEMFHRRHGLPCVILRTSRFFPEPDDRPAVRDTYDDDNAKANEFLYRRVDVEDVVDAHRIALDRAATLRFDRFIISATTPFAPDDAVALRTRPADAVRRLFPAYEAEYARRGWRMFPEIERVYVNARARAVLGWAPRYDFACVLERLIANQDPRSALSRTIGVKGYHAQRYRDGLYPTARRS
jgi:UDP-glucose 4-epimerase